MSITALRCKDLPLCSITVVFESVPLTLCALMGGVCSVRSTTKVDVRWQDATLTTNELACELVPVLPDGNDFQPGDFVVEKGEDDPSAGIQAPVLLTRTGVVRNVNASERTCGVAWSRSEAGHPTTADDASSPEAPVAAGAASDAERVDASSVATVPGMTFGSGTDGVLSVYELVPHPDFSFRRGLPVLRLNGGDSDAQLDQAPPVESGGIEAQLGDITQAGGAQSMDSVEQHPDSDAVEDAGENADGDDDSSDWETDDDEDEDEDHRSVDAASTRDGLSIYGEVIEVCEDTGRVQVCWSDSSIQLCDPSSLFVVPDDEEMDMLDDGQYDSDGGWETASEGGSENADGGPGNQVDAVMQQWEIQESQQASIFGETPVSGEAVVLPEDNSAATPSGTAGSDDGASAVASDDPPTSSSVAIPAPLSPAPTEPHGASATADTPPPNFDCIEGTFVDHRFADRSGPATNARQFGRCVTREWGLLSGSLPDGIYVRACEEHMDLLRAVLIGPSGTPYEDRCAT
jgi:ubiquitin-conjugating enzyme E2 O